MSIRGTYPDETDGHELRETGLYWAQVTDDNDPDNRGRVRLNIPGIVANSTWAEMVGSAGGGGNNAGLFKVPKIGSTCLVGFLQGDLDSPVYWSGPPPFGGQPEGADKDNTVLQSENFRIFIQEKTGTRERKLRIEALLPSIVDPTQKEEFQGVIEIATRDGGKGAVITINAPLGVKITSTSNIEIDAANVKIKGRPVLPTDRPI